MKNINRGVLLIVGLGLCSLVWSFSARGQQQTTAPTAKPAPTPTPAEQPQNEGQVYTREVRLPIVVLDKKKQPITGLTRDDFIILEDKQPQVIKSFSDEKTSLPVYVGVLMDTSPSTAGKLRFEQESAKDFIYTVMRLRKDRVAFVTFDDEIRLRQDFTDKLDYLDRAVDAVKSPGSKTSLYDAIWQFCDEKMRGVPGNRVIVVITDGEDTFSRARLSDAIDIAQRTDTTIYAISTKAGFSGVVPGVSAGQVKDRVDRDLEKLCEATGGQAFFTGDKLELERSFTRIAKELRTQYIVTYEPSNKNYDGSFRTIEVHIRNAPGGVKIRTRDGYAAVRDNIR